MWADTTEEIQQKWTADIKQQLEYSRVCEEYDYVKKRSLVNFLTNEKLNLENHFHNRTVNMLKLIHSFEEQNLKNNMKGIVQGSLDKVNKLVKDPAQ